MSSARKFSLIRQTEYTDTPRSLCPQSGKCIREYIGNLQDTMLSSVSSRMTCCINRLSLASNSNTESPDSRIRITKSLAGTSPSDVFVPGIPPSSQSGIHHKFIGCRTMLHGRADSGELPQETHEQIIRIFRKDSDLPGCIILQLVSKFWRAAVRNADTRFYEIDIAGPNSVALPRLCRTLPGMSALTVYSIGEV